VRDTAEKRRFMACRIAASGWFKFQRRRALIGQQLGTEGAGKTISEFQNLHVL
jgi:hypothetical protein